MSTLTSLLLAAAPADLNTAPRVAFVIGHIIAAVLGVGGATASDIIFFKSISDGRITEQELSFLKTMSILVWAGLSLAALSGLGFIILASYVTPELQASYSIAKILTKLIITLIITLNGIFLHLYIMPIFENNLEKPLVNIPSFRRRVPIIFSSGAISAVSWYTVLIMGAWRGFNYPVSTSLTVYGIIVLIVVIAANILALLLIRSFKKRENVVATVEKLKRR